MDQNILVLKEGKIHFILISQINDFVKKSLILFNILIYSVLFYSLITSEQSKLITTFIGVSISGAAFFFLVTRLTLWNIYGKECISISRTELRVHKDYGWFKSEVEVHQLKNLIIEIRDDFNIKDRRFVTLDFSTDSTDNTPKLIYYTTLKTPFEEYQKLVEMTDLLFQNQRL
tara:strand:- start:83 stop:601 length:519 start_codon:yes stop_codon:yes gene_type:complete